MWELGGSYGSSAIGRKSAMVVAEIIKERKSRIYVSEFEGTEEKWKRMTSINKTRAKIPICIFAQWVSTRAHCPINFYQTKLTIRKPVLAGIGLM